jgi:large subunit ribosomal protein L10
VQFAQKEKEIQEFKERMEGAQVAIATSFIGINAEQANNLRKKLRDSGTTLKVYKNTLVQRALDELELTSASDYLEGPTAWAFSDDPVAPAKVLKDYNKDVPLVEMRGGVLEGIVVGRDQLDSLASLPSREELVAKVVGTIAMPLQNLVGVLNAPMRDMANVVEQIRIQKEEQDEAA